MSQVRKLIDSEAVQLLKKMHQLSRRVNSESEFHDHVAALREEYKRKTNFIKLLDQLMSKL